MEWKELRDEQWAFIEPLLPPKARTGRPRADDRKTLNGILYVLVTGCRWKDMPERYGSYKTAWRRLKEWEVRGVWEGLWKRLLDWGYGVGRLSWERVGVDATTVEAKKGGNLSASTVTAGGRGRRSMGSSESRACR
nr:IS5 family transposase [Thermus albus]